jgi:hypothetical protein
MERTIPNEPGALLDALLEFNKTPEGQECLLQLKEMFANLDNEDPKQQTLFDSETKTTSGCSGGCHLNV